MNRAYCFDRIRVVLTAFVVFHHTAITYGAPGGWYYNEIPLSLSLTGLLLILFVSVNQAYFMGFFFLLSGYFTPNSYNRKSLGQFAFDRLLRLGIPLAVFAFVLDPLTSALVLSFGKVHLPFWGTFTTHLVRPGWNPGPLWFAEALLIFSAGYILYRINRKPEPRRMDAPIPGALAWFLSASAVGIAALLLRQWVPVGESFAGHLPNVNSGFSIPAILYAFWEPFVAWGIIAAMLVWFRQHANNPSAVWEFLAARAYAVYIIHAPVLVAISLLLKGWQAPALAKVAVTGSLACCGSVVAASLLLILPGARRVL